MGLTLGPVLGRLGGGVEETPVQIADASAESTGSGTRYPLATVQITRRSLVIITGTLTGNFIPNHSPQLYIGATETVRLQAEGYCSMAVVVDTDTTVGLITSQSTRVASFTGIVYTVPL